MLMCGNNTRVHTTPPVKHPTFFFRHEFSFKRSLKSISITSSGSLSAMFVYSKVVFDLTGFRVSRVETPDRICYPRFTPDASLLRPVSLHWMCSECGPVPDCWSRKTGEVLL